MEVPTPRQFEQSQSELGYHLDPAEEYLGVCPDCIADDGLRRFVASHAQIRRCHFCGGAGTQGLRLGALFDYMGRCLQAEWDLAINELYYGERGELWENGGATILTASTCWVSSVIPWPTRSCAQRSRPPSTTTGFPGRPFAWPTMSA